MTLSRLVLFSGWGIDARIWQPLIACLHARRNQLHASAQEAFEIVAPDWPEEGPDSQSALPTTLGGAETLWLGWSLGALRAEALARSQPPAALISLAMGPILVAQQRTRLTSDEQTLPALAPQVLADFRTAFARNPAASWQHFLRWQASGETCPRACLKKLRALIGSRPSTNEEVLGDGLAELASRQMTLDSRHEFWLGKQDPLLAAGLAKVLRRQGHAVKEFEGGHCLPLSATEALADALLMRMGLITHPAPSHEEV